MERSLRAAATFLAFSAGAALFAGCDSFKPKHHIVPGPSGAIAAAPLSGGRAAVLAGTDTTRAVYIIDLETGQIDQSFGVTREATGISAATPSGPLFISIAVNGPRRRPAGAIERWGLQGRKTLTLPAAGPVAGITQVSNGLVYALITGAHDARSAVPLDVHTLRFDRPIPLDAAAESLQLCKLGALDFLAYTIGSPGPVILRDLASGAALRSQVTASNPNCLGARNEVFAVQKTLLATNLVVLNVPEMLQASTVPMSADLRSLYITPRNEVLALNGTRSESTLELLPSDSITPAAAASAAH